MHIDKLRIKCERFREIESEMVKLLQKNPRKPYSDGPHVHIKPFSKEYTPWGLTSVKTEHFSFNFSSKGLK